MTLKLTQLSLLCPVCGAEVPPSGRRGPRRTYCSEACKQAAYRRRARGAPEDLPRQGPTGRRRTLVVGPMRFGRPAVWWRAPPRPPYVEDSEVRETGGTGWHK